MTNEVTIDKLIEMRFTAMADAFRIQENDPAVKKTLLPVRLPAGPVTSGATAGAASFSFYENVTHREEYG